MSTKKASSQTGNGEELFENVTLPLSITVPLQAGKQVSFNVHKELSGNVKLPPLAAALTAEDGTTLFSTADSRTLGSNHPHFVTVGKPKHTNSNDDVEIEPQTVTYTLVAIGAAADLNRKVTVGVQHA